MAQPPPRGEKRTKEQLRQHYEVEKELASRLRTASKRERRHLYRSLYNELFTRVPLHPQLTRKTSPSATTQAVRTHMRWLRRFVKENMTFLEVGPGDCALSVEVAKLVKQVYAVDVSDEIALGESRPPNFQLVLSDGVTIPVPRSTVDVAFSNQLMEHLHPDDAFEQLENIYQALVPGGVYACITPNRLNGPHDISKFFDEVATGFHMKEYTTSELSSMFRKVGFSRVGVYVGAKGRYTKIPAFLVFLCEALLDRLPSALRRAALRFTPVRGLLGIRIVGVK